jgi:hypothetical protein
MKALDLSGKKFGKLTAIEVVYVDRVRKWRCVCECGNEVIVRTSELNAGYRTTCGSCRTKVKIGDRYGKLVVISLYDYARFGSKYKRPRFLCKCDCGNKKIVFSHYLTSGKTTHCGCLTKEKISQSRRHEYGMSLCNRVIDSYKRNAKNKSLDFNLTKEYMIELFNSNCYYCGSPPSHTIRNDRFYGEFTYNGIDRLDPKCGYVYGNVVPCCQTCNYLKGAYTEEEFLEIVRKIAVHRNLI